MRKALWKAIAFKIVDLSDIIDSELPLSSMESHLKQKYFS